MFNFIKSLFSTSKNKGKTESVEPILPQPVKELTELDKAVIRTLEVAYEKPITENLYGDQLSILAALAAINSIDSSIKWETEEAVKVEIYSALFSYFETRDYYSTLQKMEEVLLGEKFKWEIYDNCVEKCEELQLYPYYYRYLQHRPKAPESIKQVASLLTMNQMKAVLKRLGMVNLPKIKESVSELFVTHCSLEDCQPEIEERLSLVNERFEHRIRREKINAILLTTIARKEAIERHYVYSVRETDPLNPILKQWESSLWGDDAVFFQVTHQDNPVISENGEVLSLPPYYPADKSHIDYYGDEL